MDRGRQGGGMRLGIELFRRCHPRGRSDHVSWALYIANFTFLVGLAAGGVMMVIPSYLYHDEEMHDIVLIGELLAVAAIVMSLMFVFCDLGRPDRFWHLIPGLGRFNFPVSMLTWDVIVLNGYLLINLHICGYLLYMRFLGRKPNPKWYLPFVFLSIIWAISIHTVTGFLYCGLGSRPFSYQKALEPYTPEHVEKLSGVPAAKIRMLGDQGGDISTVFVQVTNPGQSLPNLRKLFQAKKGLADKFLIVSEVYPTATTELADLVLPAALWVEKNGLFGNSERRTQQWFKMVNPPGNARDDCWMTIALARRLFELGHPGMKDKDGKFLFTIRDDAGHEVPVWEWKRYYDVNADRSLFEEYRTFSLYKHKNLAPYAEYVTARGLRWPVVQQANGSWRETKFRFSEFDDSFVRKGAEIQFYHSVTKDDKALIWFAPYVKAAEEPDQDFPFWLCTGRVLEHWHTGSMTMRIPQLQGAMPRAYVEMHPNNAADHGIANGETIVVKTRRGELSLPVWINGRARPPRGTLFMPFFDQRLLVNDLTLGDPDPISFEPDYKKCAAAVGKPDAGRTSGKSA